MAKFMNINLFIVSRPLTKTINCKARLSITITMQVLFGENNHKYFQFTFFVQYY